LAPGLNPASIEVHVDKGVLSIAGERAPSVPGQEGEAQFYARERFSGAFKRVVGLPEDIDASRIQATYRNGVLRVAIPKRAPSKPRRIEIQGHEQIANPQ
jgi:HSP20 family protein